LAALQREAWAVPVVLSVAPQVNQKAQPSFEAKVLVVEPGFVVDPGLLPVRKTIMQSKAV
jgi:hypothetical protein